MSPSKAFTAVPPFRNDTEDNELCPARKEGADVTMPLPFPSTTFELPSGMGLPIDGGEAEMEHLWPCVMIRLLREFAKAAADDTAGLALPTGPGERRAGDRHGDCATPAAIEALGEENAGFGALTAGDCAGLRIAMPLHIGEVTPVEALRRTSAGRALVGLMFVEGNPPA